MTLRSRLIRLAFTQPELRPDLVSLLKVARTAVLYHGTTEKFDRFELARAGRRDSGNLGRGIYLSADVEVAQMYAERNSERFGGVPTVYRVQANIGDVAVLDATLRKRLTEEAGVPFPPRAQDPERSERLRTWFLANGFDSVKSGDEYVVFDPKRLKIVGEVPFESESDRLRRMFEEATRKR